MNNENQARSRVNALRASVAACVRVARPGYDGSAATQAAREGYWAALEAECDPRGDLGPQERRARAVAAWRARMQRGKLKRAVKAARKEGR